MEKIMAAAGPLAVTFHRASICALTLYIHSIILRNWALPGTDIRAKIRRTARFIKNYGIIAHRDAPIIMAGAGVRAENCTTSSMPECWKSIAPRERGNLTDALS